MEIKKFIDIERIRNSYAGTFEVGEPIVVEVKIDGANASFCYDTETDSVVAFSRRKELTPANTLEGFFGFVSSLDKEIVKSVLDSRYIVFGEWLCLSGDTVVKKVSGGRGKTEMTLKEMYEMKYKPRYKDDEICKKGIKKLLHLLMQGKEINKSNYNKEYQLDKTTTIKAALNNEYILEQDEKYILTQKGKDYINEYYFSISQWGHEGFPSLYSLNLESDKIETNKMQDIVYTGVKTVYRLTTHKGYSIKATANHPFLTPKGWTKLEDLKIYDCVAVTDFISRCDFSRHYGIGTREIFRKQKEYKERIGCCEICGATTNLHLHHIDKNHFNNTEENWQVLCQDCHSKIHIEDKRTSKPKYDYEFDYIIDIEEVGMEECYDICMTGDENIANFIANNFIVHNCKHTVQYPKEMYKQFYMYDVYDTEIEQYLPYDETIVIFEKLKAAGIQNFANVLYKGEFKSWEATNELLKANTYGEKPCMEGIVIKRQSRLDSKSSSLPFYIKIVNQQFSEVHTDHVKKEFSPEELAKIEAQKKLVAAVVTERRCQKIVEKLIEDGVIPRNWGPTDMGVIAKNMPKLAYEDCRKEEPEIIEKVENFGKYCSQIAMAHVRTLLERQ